MQKVVQERFAALAASVDEVHVCKRCCTGHVVHSLKGILKFGHTCVPQSMRVSLLWRHEELHSGNLPKFPPTGFLSVEEPKCL